MNYLILLAIILCINMQSVMMKQSQKEPIDKNGIWFTAVSAFCAMLVFVVVNGGKFVFSASYIPYSVGFAVSYATAFVCSILALLNGPMSLTLLLQSYSLLIPTFYGVIFLNEDIGITFWIGIVLLALCLFLTYFEKNEKGEKITLRWAIFAILSFVGNGMCSLVQKMLGVSIGDTYKNEFMIVALMMISLSFIVFGFAKERKELPKFVKRNWYFGALCGLFNGGVNFGVLMLSQRMPASIQFPMISAGSILSAVMFSVLLYKERLSKRQWCGFAVGVLAIVCLNL